MPASRSRTERWSECLHQVLERGGGIEIAVAKPGETGDRVPDVMWRVRLLEISEKELIVERPAAAGQSVEMPAGTALVGVMSIGQNRWTFQSSVIGVKTGIPGRPAGVLRIQAPQNVQRCQRREHMRISTSTLSLPTVECWPLLNPTSVVAAEMANRAVVTELARTGGSWQGGPAMVMPEVGPSFSAKLGNIGGGGLGLVVDKSETHALGRSPLIWMRLDLRPSIVAPIAMTGRIAHTHLDHEQSLHLGVAFDFSFNAGHRDFVVSQISSYVAKLTAPIAKAA